MSAAAPNPNNMLVLAVLGIGAFWFMSRRAVASPLTGLTLQQQAQQQANAQKNNLIAQGLNGVVNLIGKFGLSSGSSGASGASSGVTGTGYFGSSLDFGSILGTGLVGGGGTSTSIADYMNNDGVAINPVGIAGYDFFTNLGFN